MTIGMLPELKAAIQEEARKQGINPEVVAFNALYERFVGKPSPLEPRDDWERQMLSLPIDCGVSLSDETLRRESMYE